MLQSRIGVGLALPRFPERPFRPLSDGILLEILRARLGTVPPQSVPAFHSDKGAVGTPLLQRSQRSPTPIPTLLRIKVERAKKVLPPLGHEKQGMGSSWSVTPVAKGSNGYPGPLDSALGERRRPGPAGGASCPKLRCRAAAGTHCRGDPLRPSLCNGSNMQWVMSELRR